MLATIYINYPNTRRMLQHEIMKHKFRKFSRQMNESARGWVDEVVCTGIVS
jgi:hypothetical protein